MTWLSFRIDNTRCAFLTYPTREHAENALMLRFRTLDPFQLSLDIGTPSA
jgi:hypothetical protein